MTTVTAMVYVAVASNLQLLAETVTTALEGCGFSVVRVPWPHRDGDGADAAGVVDLDAQVLLVVGELDTDAEIEALRELLSGYGGRSLVLAGSRPGESWGAALDAGADSVVGSTTTLDEVVERIESLARGERLTGVAERQVLVRQWRSAHAERQALRARLDLLTPREREVLHLLHLGTPPAAVAAQLGVSEATVRSQIRGILGKLEVGTQLAAVAALESALTGPSGRR